jgi:primosomal replication protein N
LAEEAQPPKENWLQLTASVVERDAVRHTPAGVPVISVRLFHQSVCKEADTARLVEMEIPAIAVGNMADKLGQLPLEQAVRFSGFLANRNRKSRQLVFHISDFSL